MGFSALKRNLKSGAKGRFLRSQRFRLNELNKRDEIYGIILHELSIYDIIIDSSIWRERDIVEMIKVVMGCVKEKQSA